MTVKNAFAIMEKTCRNISVMWPKCGNEEMPSKLGVRIA